jgi:hypothetical protein
MLAYISKVPCFVTGVAARYTVTNVCKEGTEQEVGIGNKYNHYVNTIRYNEKKCLVYLEGRSENQIPEVKRSHYRP